MATDAKARMIDGAVRLLAQHGPQGTSFSEVLAVTGAPRGSIYYHFPGGKDELVEAAVRLAGERAAGALEEVRGLPAREVAAFFLGRWRLLLTATGYAAGCSVASVSLAGAAASGTAKAGPATSGGPSGVSSAVTDAAAEVFRGWTDQLAGLLAAGGVPADAAPALAATLIAGAEGAVVMARVERGVERFDQVAATLVELVDRSRDRDDL